MEPASRNVSVITQIVQQRANSAVLYNKVRKMFLFGKIQGHKIYRNWQVTDLRINNLYKKP